MKIPYVSDFREGRERELEGEDRERFLSVLGRIALFIFFSTNFTMLEHSFRCSSVGCAWAGPRSKNFPSSSQWHARAQGAMLECTPPSAKYSNEFMRFLAWFTIWLLAKEFLMSMNQFLMKTCIPPSLKHWKLSWIEDCVLKCLYFLFYYFVMFYRDLLCGTMIWCCNVASYGILFCKAFCCCCCFFFFWHSYSYL